MHRKLIYFAGTSMAAFFIAACAVGPNYQRPEINSPAAFRDQSNPGPNGSIADYPWWSVFHDQALQQLIREALTNNYDLRIAVARIAKERALLGQARANFFPQLGYQGGASRLGGSQDFTVDNTQLPAGETAKGERTTDNVYEIGGNATWELDLWGRIRRENEAATARLLASEEARRGVVQSLVADVASNYFQLRELDMELDIAKRNRDAFSNISDIFTKQKAGGVASNLEVSRSTALEAQVSAAIPQIELQIALMENYLCLLLGRNPGPIPRGAALTDQYSPPDVPAGVPSALLDRRPDVRQAEQELIAANAEIGAATADFLPTLDLTAALGVVSPQLSLLTSGSRDFWNVGGALTGPLFQGGRLVAHYQEMKAVRDKALLEYQRAALAAFVDVSDALVSRRKDAETSDQEARQVEALLISVKLARERYEGGISTYIELLDAQEELFPAEISLARTRLAQLNSIVQLYKALGGGWFESEQSPQQQPTAATQPVQQSVSKTPAAQQSTAANHPVQQSVSKTPAEKQPVAATRPVQQSVSKTPAEKQPVAATRPVQQSVSKTPAEKQSVAATRPVQQSVSKTPAVKQSVAATRPVQQSVSKTPAVKQPVAATHPVQQSVSKTPAVKQPVAATHPVQQSVSKTPTGKQSAVATHLVQQPLSKTPAARPAPSSTHLVQKSISATHPGQQPTYGNRTRNSQSPSTAEVPETTF